MSKVKKVKLKTNRAAAKRFKLAGNNKVRFRRANRSHLNTGKAAKLIRQNRDNSSLSEPDARLVRRLLVAS